MLDLNCTWSKPTEVDNVMKCNDGSYCSHLADGWICCNDKGGRAKCPQNVPNMCAEKKCANNMDHCCVIDGICEEYYGGKRPCSSKYYANFMTFFFKWYQKHLLIQNELLNSPSIAIIKHKY